MVMDVSLIKKEEGGECITKRGGDQLGSQSPPRDG